MSVNIVKSGEALSSAPSPFAAPMAATHDETRFLSVDDSLRVSGHALYCRNDTDLSHICWLTGQREDLVRARCLVMPVGAMGLLAFLLPPFVAFGVAWLTFASGLNVHWAGGFVAAGVSGCLVFRFLAKRRRSFRLHVGVSANASRRERMELITRWVNRIWFAVAVTGILSLLDGRSRWASSQDIYQANVRLLVVGIIVWAGGSLIIHMMLRPRFFRVDITSLGDDTFAIRGLTPEFLSAAIRHGRTV